MRRECDVELLARGPKGAWAHILIPFDAARFFGRRGLIPITGSINGHPFRSPLMPEGKGRHYLNANKAMLAGAKAQAGETVHLELEQDQAERTIATSPEFEATLAAEPAAAAIAALCYSQRKEYADWITGARKQETRASRAAKAIGMILTGKPAARVG